MTTTCHCGEAATEMLDGRPACRLCVQRWAAARRMLAALRPETLAVRT